MLLLQFIQKHGVEHLWPLRHVVAAAYRVRRDKVSGPPWMEDGNFDIEAKLPEGAKGDQAHEMLQTLLAERFGLECIVKGASRRDSRWLAKFETTGRKGSLPFLSLCSSIVAIARTAVGRTSATLPPAGRRFRPRAEEVCVVRLQTAQ